ncbi:MAG: hypothetical protein KatS3mg023_3681 [Armatimonadota bacterium]|nr:MAG: hypothetical protein KatS3mg023_3681 [Armatimonadota bacterium]
MRDSSREVSRPFVELRGHYGMFAAKNGWFNLYYADGSRPDWMDVGELLSVYIIGPNGGLLQFSDPGERSAGEETYVGEVISVERLRLVDLENRHLMDGVPSCSSRRAVLSLLRKRGGYLLPQDPIEVVRVRRVSYAVKDLVGPLSSIKER